MNREIIDALKRYIGMGDTDANLKQRLMTKLNMASEQVDSYLAAAHAELPQAALLVPAELKAKPNWVRWKLEQVNERLTKVPYQINGSKASSTNPVTWNTYEAVIAGAAIDETQGVGVVTDDTFSGFDLDGCRNPANGEITEWAKRK